MAASCPSRSHAYWTSHGYPEVSRIRRVTPTQRFRMGPLCNKDYDGGREVRRTQRWSRRGTPFGSSTWPPSSFLREVCGADESLRCEVESLLAYGQKAEGTTKLHTVFKTHTNRRLRVTPCRWQPCARSPTGTGRSSCAPLLRYRGAAGRRLGGMGFSGRDHVGLFERPVSTTTKNLPDHGVASRVFERTQKVIPSAIAFS
jgi:hypothetical protein